MTPASATSSNMMELKRRSGSVPDLHSPTAAPPTILINDNDRPLTPTARLAQSETLLDGAGGNTGSLSGAEMADMKTVAARGRQLAAGRERNRRLVQKTGDCNVTTRNVTKRRRKFLFDLFTTMVDMKWRWHVVTFVAVFVVTWVIFAIVWFLIAYCHGDLDEHKHLTVNCTTEPDVCVEDVFDFRSALLFSIETQATIGYGKRVIQTGCAPAIAVLMIQSLLGLFIQALATGIIFAKISRPKGRSQTILFSRRAVICKRDGDYCLLFRVGDMRNRSHIIGTSIRGLLVNNRMTAEGESIPLCQSTLQLETETSLSDSYVFFVWPVTITHRIDSSSPLWDVSASDLVCPSTRFEIIVILEGTVESTGSLTQVRTSYLPSEIGWGERMCPLMTYQRHNGHYEIDYSQFHNTAPVATMPECSAKVWAERSIVPPTTAAAGDKTAGFLQLAVDDYQASFTTPAIRAVINQTTSYNIRQLFGKSHRHLTKRTQPAAAAADEQTIITQGGAKAHRFTVKAAADDVMKKRASLPLNTLTRDANTCNGEQARNGGQTGNGKTNKGLLKLNISKC